VSDEGGQRRTALCHAREFETTLGSTVGRAGAAKRH